MSPDAVDDHVLLFLFCSLIFMVNEKRVKKCYMLKYQTIAV